MGPEVPLGDSAASEGEIIGSVRGGPSGMAWSLVFCPALVAASWLDSLGLSLGLFSFFESAASSLLSFLLAGPGLGGFGVEAFTEALRLSGLLEAASSVFFWAAM